MNAFILYDNLVTGIRAKALLDQAVHHLEVAHVRAVAVWKSQLLCEQALLESAARDAAASSIVVLALEVSEDLPAAVLCWMDRWLALRDRAGCMFLAVVEARGWNPAAGIPAHEHLQRAAEADGVHLFLHVHNPDTDGDFLARPGRSEEGHAGVTQLEMERE